MRRIYDFKSRLINPLQIDDSWGDLGFKVLFYNFTKLYSNPEHPHRLLQFLRRFF